MLSVTYRPFMLSAECRYAECIDDDCLAPAKWLLLWYKHQRTALSCSIGLIVYNQSMNFYV
jgi:hypothetical protein